MKTKLFFQVMAVLLSLAVATLVYAQSSQSLINPASFRGPAADQRAYRVGDILTVYVLETTRARSQAATDSDRSTGFAANLSAPSTNYDGSIVLQGKTKGAAQTSRIGELRAQLTVRVEAVEANGLMRIQGTQILEVNKEQQKITLSGLVRPEDISAGNIVWSTRIADAQVSLAGKGIVSEAQRKSLISRVFTWLGLL